MSAADYGYVGRDAEAMMERDNRVCRREHKCASHGSYSGVHGHFVSVGGGACGFCGCKEFTASNTSEPQAVAS